MVDYGGRLCVDYEKLFSGKKGIIGAIIERTTIAIIDSRADYEVDCDYDYCRAPLPKRRNGQNRRTIVKN